MQYDYDYNTAIFQEMSQYLLQHTGITLGEAKQGLVYTRLSKRLRQLGVKSFREYLALVKQSKEEHQYFVNSLTTNLTYFFREEHHFEYLKTYVKEHPKKDLKVWCAAASTGEEVWSIAITLAETLGADFSRVQFTATDLATDVLETAKAGKYPLDIAGKFASKALLDKYFVQRADGYEVSDVLKKQVSFKTLNLVGSDWSAISRPIDVVFCRNVLIYFERPTQYEVVRRIGQYMVKGGVLFVGHSENFTQGQEDFHLLGRTIYTRN